MSIQKMCRECGNSYEQFNTTQTRCQLCTYNRYVKPNRPIKRMGKQAKLWSQVRANWFKENHADEYECYICGDLLTVDDTTLDHVIPRSNASNHANRHNESNLKPCCWNCNQLKGSKHDSDIMA